jgi:hypothetical protein
MSNPIFNIGLGAVLSILMTFGAAAQPSNSAPSGDSRPHAKDQSSAPQQEKNREQPRPASRNDLSRDPDRSAIGPRTTQGLAQDAISRSN